MHDNISALPAVLYKSCFEYQMVDDLSRVTTYQDTDQPSDRSSHSLIHWYRLTGKQIVQSCPPSGSCGTQSPGWINGQYPSKEAGIKSMDLCYRSGANCCASKVTVSVRQCHGYYIFKFDNFPSVGRFCSEKGINYIVHQFRDCSKQFPSFLAYNLEPPIPTKYITNNQIKSCFYNNLIL